MSREIWYSLYELFGSASRTPLENLLHTLNAHSKAKPYLTPEGSFKMLSDALDENGIDIKSVISNLESLMEELKKIPTDLYVSEQQKKRNTTKTQDSLEPITLEQLEEEYQKWKDVKLIDKKDQQGTIYVIATSPTIKDNIGYYQLVNINNNPPVNISVPVNELWDRYELHKP